MKYFLAILALLSGSLFAKSFTIMSYNVQNLFDSKHDYGKDDYTYLPLWLKNESYEIRRQCTLIQNDYWRKSCLTTDWSEEVVEEKIENICRVISASSPDIILLQEVENKSILTQMFTSKTCGEEYMHLSLVEGSDSRGIDTAVVSKFPITSETLHEVDLAGVAKPTRGILEVEIKVGNKSVTVFSNHWPSQANPSLARFKAAEVLVEKALESNSDLIVAAGDFNTVPSDSPHGLNLVVRPHVYDSDLLARRLGTDVFPGSHWYRGHWGRLDKIFVFKKSSETIKADYKSFQIFSEEWMFKNRRWTDYDTGEVTYHNVPFSFSWKNKQGYSDHLPLLMSFSY